jgi:hypothetical protein
MIDSWHYVRHNALMSETSEQRWRKYKEQGLLYHEFKVEDKLYGVCVDDDVQKPLTVEDVGVIWLRTIGRHLYPRIRQETRDRKIFFDSLGIPQQVQF